MASSSYFILAVIACTLLQFSMAYPIEEEVEYEPSFNYVELEEPHIYQHQRYGRSLQPGAPNFPGQPGQQNQDGWKFDPSLTRDEDGNTKTSINVQNTGPNHRVDANWDKVIRGPGRAKPTYSIRGSWKW